ncbi:hypothetical protein PVK06_042860 [Gossypium arboreum]|uniref:DUF2634 domain-containing protein n=1 Tax=Gossypium arboreum TaxID=29729 RepID=A0ABR0MPF3_GOSAR|nr:hypothetical protein PVK06_042860 [Gossypium arboreum]
MTSGPTLQLLRFGFDTSLRTYVPWHDDYGLYWRQRYDSYNDLYSYACLVKSDNQGWEVVEPHDLKVDSQQEIKIRELSEVLGVIEEISNSHEVSVEEPSHFSDVLEETLRKELVKEVLYQRHIQIKVENSEQVEFVIEIDYSSEGQPTEDYTIISSLNVKVDDPI